jgi:hypothetical protein
MYKKIPKALLPVFSWELLCNPIFNADCHPIFTCRIKKIGTFPSPLINFENYFYPFVRKLRFSCYLCQLFFRT